VLPVIHLALFQRERDHALDHVVHPVQP
jgi:hypothetical protein